MILTIESRIVPWDEDRERTEGRVSWRKPRRIVAAARGGGFAS